MEIQPIQLDVGSFEFDKINGLIQLDDKALKIFGIKRSGFSGMAETICECFHPEDRELVHKYLFNDILSTEAAVINCRIIRRDGKLCNIRVNTLSIQNQKNQNSITAGTIQDVTAQMDIEKKLNYANARARMYLDIANIIFLVLNKHGEVDMINKKGSDILGLNEKDIIGMNWFDHFVPKDIRAQVKKVFKQIIAGTGENVDFYENPIITSSGEERIISWHNTILKDIDGVVTGVLSAGNDITQRKIAEQAILESEDKFRYVFENSAIGKSLTLPTGEVNINSAFCDMLGYSRDELEGVKWQDLTHPDDIAHSQKQLDKVLKGQQDKVSFNKRYIRKDGNILWANVHTCMRSDENNRPLYFMTSLIDITSQLKAEEELKRSEIQYRQLFNAMRDGYALHEIISDKKGKPIDYRFLAVNPAFEQLTGLKAKDILNRTVLEALPEMEPVWIENYERVALTGVPLRFEEYAEKIGKHYEINAYQPAPNQVACTFRDVTQERKAKDALMKNEKRLLAAQALAHVGNWELDIESNIVWGSEETARIYEVIGPTLPYEKIQRLVFPEYHEMLKNAHNSLYSGAAEYDVKFKIKTGKTGTIKYIHSRAVAETDDIGKIVKISGVTQDVTEQKKLEEELKYLSYHDHLTGLKNRRFLDENIDAIDRESSLPISIIMGDLNGLKIINDSLGHHMGDELIKLAAQVIKAGCTEGSTLIRYGGDEFLAILPNINEKETKRIISQTQRLAANTKISGVELSVSFGSATKMKKKEHIFDVLTKAENNMYKHKLNQRSTMHSKTINIIMKTLFEKSNRESEHSSRVSKYAEAIAKQMSFTQDEVDEIRIAGLVHDIGKISIKEAILNKKGALTHDEWKVIKNHPSSGWRILSSSNDFSEIADLVRAHHERWDGKGYPNGLKGNKIPLGARIIAVADSYDAMTSLRTYRDKFKKERAVEELVKCAGTQFDPKIVDVFVHKVLAQKYKINS